MNSVQAFSTKHITGGPHVMRILAPIGILLTMHCIIKRHRKTLHITSNRTAVNAHRPMVCADLSIMMNTMSHFNLGHSNITMIVYRCTLDANKGVILVFIFKHLSNSNY